MQIGAIVNFLDLPFKEAVVENVILVLRKTDSEKERESNKINILGVIKQPQFVQQKQILQRDFLKNDKKSFNIFLDKSAISLREKISSNTKPLGTLVEINQAIALKHERAKYLSKEKIDDTYKPVLDGRNINRYSTNWGGEYLRYDIKAIHSCKREDIFLAPEKLFFRRVGDRLIATLDNQKFYALNTLIVMTKKSGVRLNVRCLLGLFNSKLMNYYYQRFLKSTKKVFSEIQTRQIKNLPIKEVDELQKKYLIGLVDKILVLNERLIQIGDKQTVAKARIDAEIKAADNEIDEFVYNLYGITDKEKRIIEGS